MGQETSAPGFLEKRNMQQKELLSQAGLGCSCCKIGEGKRGRNERKDGGGNFEPAMK